MVEFSSLVRISPSQNVVHFPMPYNVPSKVIVTLTNLCGKNLCLKIKTTAPDLYQVQPTLALITPDSPTKIKITMFANSAGELTKSIATIRHRFLFMVAYGPQVIDSKFNQVRFWRNLPAENIFQQKLRCEFDENGLDLEKFDSDRDFIQNSKVQIRNRSDRNGNDSEISVLMNQNQNSSYLEWILQEYGCVICTLLVLSIAVWYAFCEKKK